ncbi:MAG TPA: hypothetical protein PKZ40_03620 [Anaerolineaceae bacterium]|nr:hypothetical protein [Anaerolineaceae bacterium]HPK26811.1 hypothetical protein [Anaerolineaceae bacterium]
MKKQKIVGLIVIVALFGSIFAGVSQVQASTYPTFSISEVKTDESVTILTNNMPANKNFNVLMGEIGTKGIDGIVVATLNSDKGGSFLATFPIPEQLKGRAQIAIRLEGTDNPYYAYNWFWNDAKNGTWPEDYPPAQPPTCACNIPTFSIKSVVKGEDVTITTYNFPKNMEFTVLMGKMWTRGINGIEVATLNSGEGGSFEATFDIPAELANEERIAIRLEGTGGYYAYNWFWNNTASTPPAEPVDGYSGYPYFFITAVEKDTTVSIKAYNLPEDTDFTVLMGKMWTMGINGIEVTTLNSGEGGTLEATFDIPAELAGEQRIAIRLQGEVYYAYNWFWNNTTN